ncbi:MAG: histidine phosphatase family protein [Flavobacteriaceae bacterium]|nr:histidine phosphatase family protein [Flavobacteriaceae bacterium]NNM08755.1 histidine phosphatase family protein [Flavobacteriaceae bacterium]
MKTLVLVRHAKSSWEHDLPDRDRPLKKRGVNDSNLVSKAFTKDEFRPQKIISSPANRAFSTCRIFMQNLSYSEVLLEKNDNLYDFGGFSVLNVLKSLDNDLDAVMIFGHNHAFTSLSNSLGDRYIDNLPTSGLVKIELAIDKWSDLKKGKTVHTIFPRDLK